MFDEQGLPLRSCRECGGQIKRSTKYGPRPVYCGSECCTAFHRRRHSKKLRIRSCVDCDRIILEPRKQQTKCSVCKNFTAQKRKAATFLRFVRNKGGKHSVPRATRYCNTCLRSLKYESRCRECCPPPPRAPSLSDDIRAWPTIRISDCRWCGFRYLHHGHAPFCSDTCRSEAKKYRPTWHRKRDQRHTCGCGTPLPNRRHRCDECKRATAKARKQSERRRARAKKYGVTTGRYTMALIAERDKYTCGLCSEHVDMSLVVPNYGAPTIDHIVPLARGGSDDESNVQLAHFICNSRASTKDAPGGRSFSVDPRESG